MRLIGVGVGPGDPELVTLQALRVLREAAVVFVPVLALTEQGRAEQIVRTQLPADAPIRRLVFALDERGGATPSRTAAWDRAAGEVADQLRRGGGPVAFATLGDPSVYSTFSYLAASVSQLLPAVRIERVAGITAMQDLAARSGTPLCEGTETLALLPLTAGADRLRAALAGHDTVVAYKGGARLPQVLAEVARAGRLAGAVYGASLGLAGERIGPASELTDADELPYLSTLLVPAHRTGRGQRL